MVKEALLALLFSFLIAGCESQRLVRLDTLKPVLPSFKTVNLEVSGNCVEAPHQRTDLIVTSLSYFIEIRTLDDVNYAVLISDSDSDGVPDAEEAEHELDWCLSATSKDSLSDNYSDWIVHFLKIPCDVQTTLPLAQIADADGDGLGDADEGLLRSNPRNWDTDGDAIPDSLEARSRSNPLVSNAGNWAGDGYSDLEKIRLGLPFDRPITDDLNRFALRYQAEAIPTDSGLCYNDKVENIPVVPNAESNLLALYRVTSDGSDLSLEIRHLRVPSDLKDGTKIAVRWSDLEVGQ